MTFGLFANVAFCQNEIEIPYDVGKNYEEGLMHIQKKRILRCIPVF